MENNLFTDVTTAIKLEKCYIAVDPGKSGAIVAIINDKVHKYEMPLINDNLDITSLYNLLKQYVSDYNCVLVVEDVHSIFGVSAANTFTFGWVCGEINAVITLLNVKRYNVQPKAWQKNTWINTDMVYKPLKKDQKKPSVDTKATSLNAVQRLFPNEDLRGTIEIRYYGDTPENRKLKRVGEAIPTKKEKSHDGIVDALLICEMARRLNY